MIWLARKPSIAAPSQHIDRPFELGAAAVHIGGYESDMLFRESGGFGQCEQCLLALFGYWAVGGDDLHKHKTWMIRRKVCKDDIRQVLIRENVEPDFLCQIVVP